MSGSVMQDRLVPPSATIRPLESRSVYWAHAWSLVGDRYLCGAPAGSHPRDLDDDFRRQLLFCLLGGHGIGYELNDSAASWLWSLGVLKGHSAWAAADLEAELRTPRFAPARRDGSARRYRFPSRKAKVIAGAWAWLADKPQIADELLATADESQRREQLLDCPGLGHKSASWLLRNLGLATRLAILDIHVVRTMQACDRIGQVRLPNDYEPAETAYLAWCDELEVSPAGFDLLLWDWSRRRDQ